MKKYGILAFPASHSLSPQMHNSAFEHFGVEAEYARYEIHPEKLENFWLQIRDNSIYGLSISLPFKELLFEHFDLISQAGKEIGAINTLAVKDNKFYGDNTDFAGAIMALKEKTYLKGKNVLIIGAGGSTRAITYGLIKEGVQSITIANRTLVKAEKIAKDFEKFGIQIKAISLDKVKKHKLDMKEFGNKENNILIQTSSIWTKSSEQKFTSLDLISSHNLAKFDLVMDIAYKPLITPLLAAARDLGSQIITGEKMLIYQGVKQFMIWTGIEKEKEIFEVMSKAISQYLD